MRKFKEKLSLGNSQCDFDIELLVSRLYDAIVISGGLQQPAHPTSEEQYVQDQLEQNKLKSELNDCVQDIVVALVGYECNCQNPPPSTNCHT